MSTVKISWGTRIVLLYLGFVAIVVTLVIGSMRQSFDLVTPDYYGQEIKYQEVIDAGKNQAALSKPVMLHQNGKAISILFPMEFEGKIIKGTIHFYSPVNAAWDKTIELQTENNAMEIAKDALNKTTYKAEISWVADGKSYYQVSEIELH